MNTHTHTHTHTQRPTHINTHTHTHTHTHNTYILQKWFHRTSPEIKHTNPVAMRLKRKKT